ncbi:MAG: hypothetical protein NT007_19365 [Candidatus Kapabacteria bacterium]|nr:hypothetical protein [Candidatus Kapabacteria bacterium]
MKPSSVKIDWKSILYDSSTECIEHAVKLVSLNNKLIDDLLELSFKQETKTDHRASRVLCFSLIRNQEKYLNEIELVLDKLESIKHESIKFNFLKIFTEIDLTLIKSRLWLLTRICFNSLTTKVTRVAIQNYAMEILYRIFRLYPELKYELASVIMPFTQYDQASTRATSKRIMKELMEHSDIDLSEIG